MRTGMTFNFTCDVLLIFKEYIKKFTLRWAFTSCGLFVLVFFFCFFLGIFFEFILAYKNQMFNNDRQE